MTSNYSADLLYGLIMIAMSLIIAGMYIRDYRKGIYKSKFSYTPSGGYLLNLIIVLLFVFSFHAISNLLLEKIFAFSTLAILGATINVLNYKTYLIQKSRKIISNTIRIDCGVLFLSLFIGFSNF